MAYYRGEPDMKHAEAAEAHEWAALPDASCEDRMVAMEASSRTPPADMDVQDEIDNAWSIADEDTDGEHGETTPDHHKTIAAAHRRAAEAGQKRSPKIIPAKNHTRTLQAEPSPTYPEHTGGTGLDGGQLATDSK